MSAEILQELTTVIDKAFGISPVAVYDQNYIPVFAGADFLKVSVTPNIKFPEHPVEKTGGGQVQNGTITDNFVKDPTSIDLTISISSVDYLSTYNEIIQLYSNATILIVQTSVDVYENMAIMSPPHEESSDTVQSVSMTIKLREIQLVSASYGDLPPVNPSPEKASSSNTVDRGTVQPETANIAEQKQGSDLYNAFN